MNLKIKNNKLYTSQLLLEGFAVALGGRGGKEPNVILNMGKYLVESGFANYNELLSRDEFYSQNASISYPVAGLYAKFLIENQGIENFVKLYKKYSSVNTNIKKISKDDLPNELEWKEFLKGSDLNSIAVDEINFDEFKNIVVDESSINVKENENHYLIRLKEVVGLKGLLKKGKYTSKLFKELLPNKNYNGEQYLFMANENEISIYNLYTNNLIAKYVSGFTKDQMKVNKKEGYYSFLVDKILFDNSLSEYQIKIYE